MLKFAIVTAALFLLSLFNAQMLTVRKTHDPGSCSRSNHGEQILIKDRENRDTILVCTENDEVFSWKTTDNSKPPGEFFNPGYDCLDILNKNTKSKDGYYWVDFNAGKPKKVYCDMTTDGGGYILFGYINGTVTWGVPSNNETVQPFGDPHWSSEFGDVSVLDFRIQVASDDNMENTKAHWAFRFKNKRQLKNLMIVDQGGCPSDFPGVGDVSYVKDLIRDEIVSKDFSCSTFGPYSHPLAKTGWTMMNLCLQKPCPNGFAFHPIFPFQLDYSGGFSYLVRRNISTPSGGSTAFFGCEKNKCCACYGPRGGRDVYCHKGCQATNGGTITKHASAWFWIRSNPPRKVWEKCMEYRSEDESGDSAWYKLEGDRNIPVKGRCGKSELLLNDGVVVIEDGTKLKNVPAIEGLLAYREDNHTLNIRSNKTWKALAEIEKVSDIEERLSNFMENIYNSYSCKSLGRSKPHLQNGVYIFGSLKVYCDMSSGWTLLARFSNNDEKHWMSNAHLWYDRIATHGAVVDPSYNQDMFSESFWRTPGYEIKITRSDDPTHTALLETTNNCVKGNTFRELITSFGNFRNGTVWSNNKCLGSCAIKYGGLYQSTTGFGMHSCSSDIQSSNYIGFWCNWGHGDGAVMMIGGGGNSCRRADHGIGITEEDEAKFGGSGDFVDFGQDWMQTDNYEQNEVPTSYALNLWIR